MGPSWFRVLVEGSSTLDWHRIMVEVGQISSRVELLELQIEIAKLAFKVLDLLLEDGQFLVSAGLVLPQRLPLDMHEVVQVFDSETHVLVLER
jgi:hypothetical protein